MPIPTKRQLFWGLFLTAVVTLAAVAYLQMGSLVAWATRSQTPPSDVEAIPDHKAEMKGGLAALPRLPNRRGIIPVGSESGWPTLLGPHGDGSSAETGLNLTWPPAGPIEKWRIPVGTGYASAVAIGDSLILVHRIGTDEICECFDPETGASRWRRSRPATYECPYNHSSGPYAAPVLEGDRIYWFAAGGHFRCLRLTNGDVVWERDLHREYEVEIEVWPPSVSPLVEGDALIFNLGGRKTGSGIVALDKHTGETLWQATSDGAGCSTATAATIHDRRLAFVWTAEALVAVDPLDGHVLWRIEHCANNPEAAHGTPPLVVGDIVLISGFQIGNLCVRVLSDGSYEELWRGKGDLLDSQYNNLIPLGDLVCGFSSTRGRMRCLDFLTGEMRWQWRSRIRNGSTIAVDGKYLVFGENGRLASLKITPEGVEELSMTDRPVLEPPCVSYPALHKGLLFLRNEQEMVCIDLRRGEPE